MPVAVETTKLTREFREAARLFQRGRRDRIIALGGVTLHVDPGECVALVGPNGAGKSTLLRILATLALPSAGSARVCGYDVVTDSAAVRRRIGVMTGDDRSFFWRLTGFENLVFFGELQGMPTARARSAAGSMLERIGLDADAGRRFSGYSTGMRQRLALARALMHEPPVLLLDEPTANLDTVHRGQVLDALREYLSGGSAAALIASHDAGLAVALARRVVRLDHGRVVTVSSGRPAVRYCVRVAGLDAKHRAALGISSGNTLAVDDLGDGHALAGLLAAVISGGGEVVDVRVDAPALAELSP